MAGTCKESTFSFLPVVQSSSASYDHSNNVSDWLNIVIVGIILTNWQIAPSGEFCESKLLANCFTLHTELALKASFLFHRKILI